MESTNGVRVLVTGASGFIGMHLIKALLEQGYAVRGTLRSMKKESYLRDLFNRLTPHAGNLELVAADLTADEGWAAAVDGCRYVQHVASPFPSAPPEHEDDLIIPAREGTLRLLHAAAAAGTVERLVLTSSVAAIIGGRSDDSRPLTEEDWSLLNESIEPYAKSKTLAEQAAWTFMETERPNYTMAVINPSTVLGPLLDGRQTSTSAELILKLLRREIPGVPALNLPVVDIRDVISAHLTAMTSPQAAGKRYICSYDSVWMHDIAVILNHHFADRGYKIPTRRLPTFLVRIVGRFDPTIRLVVDRLGVAIQLDNSRIRTDLDWQPHTTEEMVVGMAESIIELDLV